MTRVGRFLIAVPVLAVAAMVPAAANAQYYRGGYGGGHGGYGGGYGGYGGGYGGHGGYGHRGFGGGGAFLGGALLGLGIGTFAAPRPYYTPLPPPVYYAPPPVVYAPPPTYYAPGYYYR